MNKPKVKERRIKYSSCKSYKTYKSKPILMTLGREEEVEWEVKW